MIESSPTLREKQRRLLCGDNPFKEIDLGWESNTTHSRSLRVVWLEDLKFLPAFENDHSPFFIAHEFFDALPIHAFQAVARNQLFIDRGSSQTDNLSYKSDPKLLGLESASRTKRMSNGRPTYEWRELMVSNSSNPKSSSHPSSEPNFEFELSQSPGVTPHSTYLPSLSDRYSSLLSVPNATIEISPESLATSGEIAKRIGSQEKPLGAALIMDYGTRETVPANTLRGIRSHTLVSPFSSPGLTDLSASVDFIGLAHAALEATPGVEVFGPTSQWQFLVEMGVEARGMALEKRAPNEEARKRINEGWKRLIDRSPRGMGLLYNALAIVPRGRAAAGGVVGFGGQLGGENVAAIMPKSNDT
jgi:NADH dehydrogenase [ubiquinone] 1 alpha subcomplex assembly factor 7